MALDDTKQKSDDPIQNKRVKPLDSGWAWIIVIGSFVINFISDGIMCSFGVIYVQLLDEFKEGRGYTSWILSLMSGMALCSGPVSSTFVDKYGFRAVTIVGSFVAAISLIVSYFAQNVFTLIITIGLGLGCSLGFVVLPAIVSVTSYFEKYRSVAVGIALSGSGVGTFVFAPLVAYLSEEFGWRLTLLVLSGIVLNCAIFGSLFRPLTSQTPSEYSHDSRKEFHSDVESQQTESHSYNEIDSRFSCTEMVINLYKNFMKMMNFELLKNPVFVLFALSDFATSMGYYVPYFCLADQATELGIPKERASHLLSIIGIANTLGRIVWGYVSDKSWANRLWVYNICLLISGVATIGCVRCLDFQMLAIYSAVFGFTIGAYVALRSVILVDVVGLDKLNNAFGLLMLFEGAATFVGPPLVGLLYDLMNSYCPGFVVAGGMIALSGLVLFFMPTLQKKVAQNHHTMEMT